MLNYSISQKIRSRKIVFLYTLIGILVLSLVAVSFLLTRNNKTARAWENIPDKLVVAENDVLYIGPGGYTSQRMWSSYGEPSRPEKQLQTIATAPEGNVYVSGNVAGIICPTRYLDGGSFVNCNAIIGDGSGMIVRYNKSIEIAGTVFITDRVILEAPNITITGTAKIIASGQNGSLGYGDNCGFGGIGGMVGGTSSSNNIDVYSVPEDSGTDKRYANCSDEVDGKPGYQSPNIKELATILKQYFIVNNEQLYGGSGGQSSDPFKGNSYGTVGTYSLLGLGGAGASGATGATGGGDKDHGSSGGSGGGFGIVFKVSENLIIDTAATITASGGDTTVNESDTKVPESSISPQDTNHAKNVTGGFGGPGGGGVIVVDAVSTKFIDSSGKEIAQNYAVFNVSAGKFDYPANRLVYKTPGVAEDGKLIVLSEIGKNVSIKKSLSKVDGIGSPYSVQPGDVLQVTLDISNLVPNQRVTITDELFNDVGTNSAVFAGGCIPDPNIIHNFDPNAKFCQVIDGKVTWELTPSSLMATLIYKIEIK